MDLSGQTALVTGGGRGLGRAFALALAAAGAAVAVTARTPGEIDQTAGLIADAGGKALAIAGDVTDRRAVDYLVGCVEQDLGPIDLLVNNAGVFSAIGLFAEVDPDEWWREVEINLRGPALCARAVLPGMIARGHGRVINIASTAGTRAVDWVSAYSTAKTALIRLTEGIANETKARGVAVFAADPGTVHTPLWDNVLRSDEITRRAPEVGGWFRELSANNEDTPIERSVQLIVDLASGKADALSGCFLNVDDALDELIARADTLQSEERLRLRLQV